MVRPGAVLAGRYVLEAVLGAGGMGQVVRAFDRTTERTVAVKLLLHAVPSVTESARFEAEIAVLAELAHPGIVGYVGHGATEDGLPFLAMEYLEGEDLRARLERRPLALGETLALARRVAEALDEAHRHGIVHRDLKPSNLFLRGGDPDRVAVLDFGIARRAGAGRGLTNTGAALGTPEYMAPEQAQGQRDVGPAADVFALGCVLYECLAGRPPWTGEHMLATLAKIVFEAPPPLAAERPDLPAPVCALVERMLAKAPAERPRDAAAVCAALDALDRDEEIGAVALATPAAGLGARELELVSVILAVHPREGAEDATLDASSMDAANRAADAVRRELTPRGASVERLADGSIVATIAQRGESAVDQAVEAALCAKVLRAAWPGAVVSVATARRVAGAPAPLGEALDRVARLFARSEPPRDATTTAPRILLDEVTAGLLHGRLRTVELARGVVTLNEDAGLVDASRPLLGKPTPCVGRDRELASLEGAVAAALDDGEPRAVLVTAPPGLGKSRLRHELLRRVARRARDAGEPGPLLLHGRGELFRASSSNGVIGAALRDLFGLAPGDAIEASRARFLEGVARCAPGCPALDTAELLGELAGLAFPDADRPRLAAARQDPRILQALVRDAFVAWLRAASEPAGALVVLEDLHWGDRGSVELVLRALRQGDGARIAVIAFARPEIHELFPGLWKGQADELPLRPLGAKPCQRLIAEVAGDRLAPDVVARIVEQSAGNALFLEELVRAACDGDQSLPETVLAMLQARIGRLETAERRVLRAASVLGESFDVDAVRAVLGPAAAAGDVARWLATLVRDEVLVERPAARESDAFRFRHGLMRDAAYGLLTDDDRRVGHRLAADYLAADEGADPAIVGEHLARAEEHGRAAPWLLRAAERALEVDDHASLLRLTDRGREHATGEALGAFLSLAAFAESMRWRWVEAGALAREAASLVPEGTATWCRAVRQAAGSAAFGNELAALRAAAERFVAVTPLPEARFVYADSALHLASSCSQTGSTAIARALVRRAEETAGAELSTRLALLAWYHLIQCTVHRHSDDTLAPQVRAARGGVAAYEACGAPRTMVVLARDVLGEVLCRAGHREEGEATLRAAHDEAKRLRVGYIVSHSSLAFGNGLAMLGGEARLADAEALARARVATPGITQGYEAMGRDLLAVVHAARGELALAEAEARAAIVLSPHTPVRRWLMVAHLADALTRQGRAAEALGEAARALAEVDEGGDGGGYAELALVVAAARAHEALGEVEEAGALAARAAHYVARQRAALATDEERALLDAAPGHVEALALSRRSTR